MKINFDENDLHLSENFIKKDKTFSYYEENIRQKLKNKISDTQEAIDMLEYSVNETITLDSTSFKAYIKNEWDWTDSFRSYASSLKG